MQVAKPLLSAVAAAPHSPSPSPRMTVVKAIGPRPLRVLIHGVEGVGKSTFAAGAPSPIFLCSEDGTSQLDIARFPTPQTWGDVLEAVRILIEDDHDFQTLVIDTLDWLEPLCWQHAATEAEYDQSDMPPHLRNQAAAAEQWLQLVGRLEVLVRTRKLNVVLVAHTQARRMEGPEGVFDRYQLKLQEQTTELREWCDVVLFSRFEHLTVDRAIEPSRRPPSPPSRIAHCTWTSTWDAKNRFELPPHLPLSWDELTSAVAAHTPLDAPGLRAQLVDLIPRLDDASRAAEVLRDWAGDNPARLFQLLDKVRSKIFLEAIGERVD
jgi:hypothetical protein